MKYVLISLFVLLSFSHLLIGQVKDDVHHAQMALNCQQCHICPKPTYEKPCLKLMPEFTREGITIFNTAEDAPEIIKIDALRDQYEPSIFTHKLHAEMAFMSGGCVSCHHFNPPGRVLTCGECHEASLLREDLSKPGLKGAYHQQCLNCHLEWSHTTNCTACHANRGSSEATATIADKAEFKEKVHPEISTPAKLVYTVDYDEGPIVTFYHNEHTDLFNLKCQNCHQNEACSRCHDTTGKATSGETKDIHENCIDCHVQAIDENCEKCHDSKERSPFDHARVGWPLNHYHKDLSCQECHGHQGEFKKVNRTCNHCHKRWNPGNFDHRVTGVVLDEMHMEIDCESCHTNRNFESRPACSECHDDLSYPESVPGKTISIKK